MSHTPSTPSEPTPRHTTRHACPIAGAYTGENLVNEIEHVLRVRLRAAAFILLAGFCAFSVMFWWEGSRVAGPFVYAPYYRAAVILVMGTAAMALCSRHTRSMKHLRIWEWVIFGVPAAFFAWAEWHSGSLAMAAHSKEAETAFCAQTAMPWISLIYLYGMFIPNHWRRALFMMGLMATVPLLVVEGTVWRTHRDWSILMSDEILTLALWLIIPVGAAVYGTHMIGRLRRQAVVGKQLGSYRLIRRLGTGGMGEVYLAEHKLLKRPCAIKLIPPGRSQDPKALARFESEVQATARLTHWNSIEIFDYGHTDDGTFYYAMEYLPGMDLQEMVETTGPLPPERAVHLLRQVCAALKEAHSLGIVHRDIKPGNIFAAERGGVRDVAKLLDFGLVKTLMPDVKSPKLTLDGALVGSPLYVAPESAMGESTPDPRSDIYSLGATAYFLLTGRPVFAHQQPLKLVFAHVNETVIPPTHHDPEIPADLEAVLLKCLEKRPEDRFQTVAELEQALGECNCADAWTDEDAEHWWHSFEDHAPILSPADGSSSAVRETTLLEVRV